MPSIQTYDRSIYNYNARVFLHNFIKQLFTDLKATQVKNFIFHFLKQILGRKFHTEAQKFIPG
jgi:hypothetical protein